MESVPVVKDEHRQQPVPSEWRETFRSIVEAFRFGDLRLSAGVEQVAPIDASLAENIAGNLKAYGGRLASLPEEAWDTSVCQWQGEYWEVLVDLFTEQEGAVDLVLSACVKEDGARYAFEVLLVYVP
ncbi:DUF7668 domain-containing protein [Caulobacter henricii]|uniref:DUF7668 domain-containing protein n=1 Tax=Caulobacter henricii TaxID=69395 RepID=A0A0P0NXS9_9CAUL|nr:hypothetical protein [Caulobacter henricii]ALL12456.1 hypothetical protein AQ619_03300 [Caulobacter henricii]